jgi:N6-L-threonylcarbamoyladenine synthase
VIKILAIESSCDDTSAAVLFDQDVQANLIYNQEIHRQYGGVIPEAASREHIKNILPVIDAALKKANTTLNELDAIAYTQSPGLIGSLLVGAHMAKSLSQVLDVPLIAVQHLQAHILSNLIEEPRPNFPFLCLTVSGGHTQLVICHSASKMEVIGETQDDAAGEAFDKTAKLLGFAYPGGPLIDKYAKEGNPNAFEFSKPKMDGLNFSFSGLKTSVLYFLQKEMRKDDQFIKNNLNDLCASIQKTIVDILISNLKIAVEKTGIRDVCIAGGVSANSSLRSEFEKTGKDLSWKTYIPKFEYCTDNAAMIGIVGYYKFLEKDFANLETPTEARSNYSI